MMEVFNRPGSEISCERRDETTVTPQAFALFNSEFSQARALAFAKHLQSKAETFPKQLHLAFARVYGRPPSMEDHELCSKHYARMLERHAAQTPPRHALPKSIRRHMVEEMTGETVYWDEDLSALANYQRDPQAADASPETRALAELCLVFLNSNEFLYVR